MLVSSTTSAFTHHLGMDAQPRSCDCTARRGGVLTLVGPNGAGRTTTIEILEPSNARRPQLGALLLRRFEVGKGVGGDSP